MQQPQDFPVAPLPTHANGWLWLPLVLAIGATIAALTTQSDTPPPLAAWLTLPFILLVGGVLAVAMRRRERYSHPVTACNSAVAFAFIP